MLLLFKSKLIFLLALILLTSFSTNKSFSQRRSDPLTPSEPQKQSEIGISTGIGVNFQTGSFFPECNCPPFDNGSNFGYSFGLVFEKDLFKSIKWGGAINFDIKNILSSYLIREPIGLVSSSTEFSDTVPILFRHSGEADFSFITAMPFIKWNITKSFYIRTGFGISIPIKTKIKHTKELLQNTAMLSNGELVRIEVDGSDNNSFVVENREFQDVNVPIFSVEPAFGFDIELNPQFFLSPGFQYSYPISLLSKRGENFTLHSWRIFLELRMAVRIRGLKN